LEHKTHFELKLGLIQWLNEKDWIKSMCIKYIINVHFFNDHRVSCLLFMTHYQTKEKWKNNTEEFIMHLLLKKCKKTHFLNWFSTKNFKLLNGLRFNWFILISFHHKNSLQNSTWNLNLKYIYKFSYLMMYLFWHKYTLYVQVCKCLFESIIG
jgi:hypothetical protein